MIGFIFDLQSLPKRSFSTATASIIYPDFGKISKEITQMTGRMQWHHFNLQASFYVLIVSEIE